MADFNARRTTMVDTQVRPSDVTKFPIIDAMLDVARERFVPEEMAQAAYIGEAIDLGGRSMLAPRTFAKLLDALDVGSGDLVLDVGCGLGYSAAILGRMAEAVIGIEDDADRAAEAQRRLSEEGIDNAAVIEAPLGAGDAKHGPYDVIVIEGGVETVPQELVDQLKDTGRIAAIFVDDALGRACIGTKRNGTVDWRFAFNADASVLPGFEKLVEFQL